MLGLEKFKNVWNWAACGKHPVVGDYFRLNLNTSLSIAFEHWIEKGYQIVSSRQLLTQWYSWRFWAKGLKKGNLICGVAKDSSDSIGRPYPLLIMGDGFLDGWEDHWEILPHAFGRVWDQMEYISSRRFDDFKELEKEVCAIKNPRQDWLEWKSKNANSNKPESLSNPLTISITHGEIKKKVRYLSKKMEVHIPLDNQAIRDPSDMAAFWCSFLKSHSSGTPNAVFMGGISEKNFLVVFNRSLNAKDFIQLWSGSYL